MRILSSLLLGRLFGQSQLNKVVLFSNTLASQYNHVERVSTHEGDLLGRYFQGKRFLGHKQHYAHFCTLRNQTGNSKQLEVEIISKEFVKPTTPTPEHLRNYEVSIFDQLTPNVYMSFVYFYLNNPESSDDLILERRQALKYFLSETLTKFYPLAGRIKDNRYIDCNDDGVYYVEGKVKDHLTHFLKHPNNKSIHKFLPVDPNSEELLSRKDLLMIQVTIFGCGSMSIGLYTGHRIIDGSSFATFLKCWASTALPSSEQINPTFISGSVYPSNPTLPHDAKAWLFPLYSKTKNSTRRFLFHAASLEKLKQKANSSRVVAVTTLIWKCAVAAAQARSKSINRTSTKATLVLAINLRDRISPPSPPHSIGNIFTITPPVKYSSENDDLELNSCAQHLKKATKQFTSEFTEKWKGYWLSDVEGTILNELKKWHSDKNAKHMVVTSICNSGIYEVDFGWGKPIWVCVGNGESNSQSTENLVLLLDTRYGNGLEAWVTLSEEDMVIFERDPEILAFASLNADPLELVQ